MSTPSPSTDLPPGTRSQAPAEQLELIPCAWVGCRELFTPRFPGQKFHAGKCRAAYRRHVGLQGRVASNVQLMHGRVSVTIHFPAESAQMAQALAKGSIVWAGIEP